MGLIYGTYPKSKNFFKKFHITHNLWYSSKIINKYI